MSEPTKIVPQHQNEINQQLTKLIESYYQRNGIKITLVTILWEDKLVKRIACSLQS